jgi:hypothetical protein
MVRDAQEELGGEAAPETEAVVPLSAADVQKCPVPQREDDAAVADGLEAPPVVLGVLRRQAPGGPVPPH